MQEVSGSIPLGSTNHTNHLALPMTSMLSTTAWKQQRLMLFLSPKARRGVWHYVCPIRSLQEVTCFSIWKQASLEAGTFQGAGPTP